MMSVRTVRHSGGIRNLDTERWLTVAQIAERLQVHQETVRRWLREGRLAGKNFGGKGGYRVRESELQAFMEADANTGKAAA
jgi:excisionase family DNA binding protein